MSENRKNIAIGFVTGRRNFQYVLRNYIYNWEESGLTGKENLGIHLYVAYDLAYNHTRTSDFTSVSPDISSRLDSIHFIGNSEKESLKKVLEDTDHLSADEADILFGHGYAASRNIILYSAIADGMDYLLFLDDDEYPMAVTHSLNSDLWSGQHVLSAHLGAIEDADITFGYHCGYISPVPCLNFTDEMPEYIFHDFIDAVSNDIINWDSISRIMNNGGVTYADPDVLRKNLISEIPEMNHARFITGSNLCLNLHDRKRILPFFNPPGARGEDTFLSTCLHDRKVLHIPCYTFHDGFSVYRHLLAGVLPIRLQFIQAESPAMRKRFYNACLGWIRYKPLYIYITDRPHFRETMEVTAEHLQNTLPAVSRFFGMDAFRTIYSEFLKYVSHTEEHFMLFEKTKEIWAELITQSASLSDLDSFETFQIF